MTTIKISMPPEWKEFFLKKIKSAQHYLEFGSGGSTILASELIGQDVISIESDPEWINKIKPNLTRNNVRFIHIDINTKPKGWGYPGDNVSDEQVRKYSQVVKTIDMNKIDLILIDGRFRVACALQILPYINEETVVLFDDFVNRPHYHIVLEYYEKIDQVLTLVQLKKKPGITVDEELLRKYELIPQ